jgi:aspartate/glutamate racemase
MDELSDNSIESIILDCTEISLAISADAYGNIPLVVMIAILADACTAQCDA